MFDDCVFNVEPVRAPLPAAARKHTYVAITQTSSLHALHALLCLPVEAVLSQISRVPYKNSVLCSNHSSSSSSSSSSNAGSNNLQPIQAAPQQQ
jgi:hypothetical protein